MIELEKVKTEDKATISEYISRMIGGANNKDIAVREVEKYFKNNLYEIYLLKCNKRTIGTSVIKNECFEGLENASEIIFLYVSEDIRGQGHGTESVKQIEKKLFNNGIEKTYCKVNVNNINASVFWLKNGFQFESRLLGIKEKSDLYLLSKVIMK